MEKSFIEKLKDAQKDYEVTFVNFYNNGTVDTDQYYMAKKAGEVTKYENELMLDVLVKATSSYARRIKFDTINMEMIMGLIYKKADIDENDMIKANAQPLNGVVRYYTGKIDSYLDGEKTNVANYYDYGVNRQGFVNYNDFVKYVKKSELTFNGPESFEEFKEKVLAGEIFDINVEASLLEKSEQKKLVRRP